MRAVESEGSTIEQAVERALILLDLTRDQVDVEVVQDPQSSGRGTALVRVSPKGQPKAQVQAQPRPKREPAPQAASAIPVSRETPGQPVRTRPAPPAPPGEVATSEEAELANTVLAELLSLMSLACRMEAPRLEEEGARIRLSVSGEDAGIVIGRQGQTLDAIEFVVNRVLERRMPGAPHVTVDAEGYRERRAQKLADDAFDQAEKVRRLGKPIALEAMSPRDRRSIHLALRDEPGVTTRSEGEGQYRHIVIEPARPLDRARIR